jgi:multidrug efflux pump subunit AcrA (membrane-fusion protein)
MNTINTRKIVLFSLGGGVVLLLLFAFLSRSSTDAAKESPASEHSRADAASPVEVPSAPAVSQRVKAFVQATGSLVAIETSDVASQASGQIIATPVNVGAFVSQGEVIARLDEREAQLRLQRAQASEQQASAALAQAKARLGVGANGQFDPTKTPEVQAARHAYERAESQARLAETNAQRYARLFETGDVARTVYDQYRTQAETARAEADTAKEQLESTLNASRSSDIGTEATAAALSAARAESALAQKTLSDSVIKAPFSGYVSERPVAVGEYVTSSTKIATIVKVNPIKVSLRLPESEAGRIHTGLNVTLNVAAYPDQQFSGKVTAMNPAIDPSSRALTVEAEVRNDRNLLRPGMFVTAHILMPDNMDGVFVPRAAVQTDSATDSSMVFVIETNTARVRVVALGPESDGLVQILSGVSAGEVVATGNLQELFDGARVIRK